MMKRGDIFWVNFEPARSGEVKKRLGRPLDSVSADRLEAIDQALLIQLGLRKKGTIPTS